MDNVFVWTGNANVFPAIIKHIEDTKNLKRDTRKGDVRSIIYIEDTPRYYSSILPMIYKETLYHTKQLIDKSLNNTQRLLHMRGRPKVLFAQDYETAARYFKHYKNCVLIFVRDSNLKSVSETLRGYKSKNFYKGGKDKLIRNYGIGAQIIKALNIKNMILVTRSKKKVIGLDGYGIQIIKQETIK